MTKYAILQGNYNTYCAEYNNYDEAKEDYDDMVSAEGSFNDLQLCKILETHEAPEQEIGMPEGARHYAIDYATPNDITERFYSPIFIKIKKLFGR